MLVKMLKGGNIGRVISLDDTLAKGQIAKGRAEQVDLTEKAEPQDETKEPKKQTKK